MSSRHRMGLWLTSCLIVFTVSAWSCQPDSDQRFFSRLQIGTSFQEALAIAKQHGYKPTGGFRAESGAGRIFIRGETTVSIVVSADERIIEKKVTSLPGQPLLYYFGLAKKRERVRE